MEINQCDGCIRLLFTKSSLGDGAAALAPSSGEESTPPRDDGVEDDATIQYEGAVNF